MMISCIKRCMLRMLIPRNQCVKRASLVLQTVRPLPAIWETWVWSLGREDPLEKEMGTHSSILAWRIPWTEKSGRLQSMGSQRVGRDWATEQNWTELIGNSSGCQGVWSQERKKWGLSRFTCSDGTSVSLQESSRRTSSWKLKDKESPFLECWYKSSS